MEVTEKDLKETVEGVKAIEAEISRHMAGQRDIIRQVVIAVLSGGNVLLEGLPGLGKTRLISTMGKVTDLKFSRYSLRRT